MLQNTESQTEAVLGPKFENLFQKMRLNVGYFVCFCNLVNILHAGPAATQVKIQIQGFLRLRKATALTGRDGAEKTTVRSRVCVSFRRVGAMRKRPVWKQGERGSPG